MKNEPTNACLRGECLPLLVFVHIPKTAGTTFNSILSHRYGHGEIHEIMMRGMSLRLPRVSLLPKPLISFSKIRRLKAALKSPRRIAVITGHLDLSLSGVLPADTQYLTLLRHPVARAISHYRHYRRRAGDPVHDLAIRSTLTEWVRERGLVEMDNGQTRRLAGEMAIPIGSVSANTLKKAKRNLIDRFSIVGVTERFDEFQVLVHRRFNWPFCRYPAQNEDDTNAAWINLNEGIVKTVEAWNRFDVELYHFAEELLNRTMSGVNMEVELSRLRSAPSIAVKARDKVET